MKEMKKAVSTLKKNKAMGEDLASIAVIELLVKQEPETMLQLFCNMIWRERKIPQDWKDMDIIVVFKNKGSKLDTNNYRGLALISQFGKILAKIIDTRLQDYCERVGINDTANQFGFRRGKGIQEISFAARRIQEMAHKLGVDLFWVFIDLKKAYDTVHGPTLWKVLSKCGIPQHMIDIIELSKICIWHTTGMQACIKMNDVRTEKFNIEVGLRQGDVMSPTLFNIYFSMVMQVMKKQLKLKFEELQKETIGVPIMFDTSVQSWDEKWKFGRLEWTEEVVAHRVRKINPKLEFEDLWNTLFLSICLFADDDAAWSLLG